MEWLNRILRNLVRWSRLLFERTVASGPPIPPGWGNVTVDPRPLLDNRRQQVADVAHGGVRRFALAYIISTSTSSSSAVSESRMDDAVPFEPAIPEDMGELHFAHFDVNANQKSAPQTVANLKAAGWVRAAIGGPVEGPNVCEREVQLFGLNTRLRWNDPEYLSFFAVGGLTDRFEIAAVLLRVRWCSGRVNMTPIPIDSDGVCPSVAIGHRGGQTKLLFVYGKDDQILGQFLDLQGDRLDSSFVIATFPGDHLVHSTDVIWNTVGDHFIVGYMHHEDTNIDSVSPNLCSVRNVRVSWDGAADEPQLHGACDPRRGGHHTSVDYDDRLATNPNGIYAWWYQDIDGVKGIRMMNASGEPTGNRVNIEQSAWTYPVTARREELPPWPLEFVFGRPAGSYVVAARASPFSGSEQRMSAWTFETDGDLHAFGLLGATPQGVNPVATEALVTESVTVWRTLRGDDIRDSWGLTVFPHSTRLVVATSED